MGLTQINAAGIFNGGIATADMVLPGVNTQIALWGRKLTENRSIAYWVSQRFVGSATFERARSYGLDTAAKFSGAHAR